LPNFFRSRSNVSRSFFDRTLATSSIAAWKKIRYRLEWLALKSAA
jgi:hypothetical protein